MTPRTAAHLASLSKASSQRVLKLISIESVMPSNHLILCCPLLLPHSIFPSIRVFSKESVLHIWWPKYCSFSFSISPSHEYSGLTSFRVGLVGYPCSPRDSQESSPTPQFSSVQSLSCVRLFATLWTTVCQASLSLANFWSLLKLMSIESVMPSNHFTLCCPLLLLPSNFSRTRIFSNELALRIRQPNYWKFSFTICPSNEYLGLISFRTDWFDLLAVQGTLKSLLQDHSSKASIL